jgi:hypothetical protein
MTAMKQYKIVKKVFVVNLLKMLVLCFAQFVFLTTNLTSYKNNTHSYYKEILHITSNKDNTHSYNKEILHISYKDTTLFHRIITYYKDNII